MQCTLLLAVVLGALPLGALCQEARDASETGLPSISADRAHDQIRNLNRTAGQADRANAVTTPTRPYGAELMTETERSEYRARLQNATTMAERERIRAAHDAEMKARASERGVVLPERPRSRDEATDPDSGNTAGTVQDRPH